MIFYDDVLEVELPGGCELVAYAHDLALVVEDRKTEPLQRKVKVVVEMIDRWMEGTFHHGRVEITPMRLVKYLGIWLGDNLIFGEHVRRERAERSLAALTRMIPNVGGLRSARIVMLCRVVLSIALFGAPVWSMALRMNKYKRMLLSLQRRCSIRGTSRTFA